MSKFRIIGATALLVALAVATPAFAAGHGGGGGGMHVGGIGGGGAMHVGGIGGGSAMHVGGIGGGRVGSPGDHDRYHGYGRGAGFAAGLAAGSALGYGYDEYSDDADSSSCAQRYQSYDPASGTYLGDDGLRHPCP